MKLSNTPLPTLAIAAGLLVWTGSAERANAQCYAGGGCQQACAPTYAQAPVIINNSNTNYNTNQSYGYPPVNNYGRYSTVGLRGYYGTPSYGHRSYGYRSYGYRSYGHRSYYSRGHHGRHGRGFGFSFRYGH